MDRIRKIFLSFSENMVYGLFSGIILYLFLVSLFSSCIMEYTYEHTFYIKDFPQLLAPGLLFLLFILFCLKGYVDDRKSKWNKRQIEKLFGGALAGLTVCWFLLMMWWIKEMPIVLTADQDAVFTGARQFLAGDYRSWASGEYMHRYPFQNTTVLLYTVFHFLFGGYALLAVRLFNLACWYAGILAICRLTERYFGKRTAIAAYVALLSFLPMFTYVVFIYGTVPSICFSVWGVYQEKRFEETGESKYLAGTGILLLLAIMWKNNAMIVMLAVMIMLAVYAIRERKIKPLWGILWIAALYWLGTRGVLEFIEAVTGEDMKSGVLLIGWVVEGLGEGAMAPGWFNGYKEKLYFRYNGDAAVMKPLVMRELKNSLLLFAEQPGYALGFFSRKTASMWSSPFFECTTLITKACPRASLEGLFENILYDGRILNAMLFLFLDVMQSVLYFGVLLFLIFGRKKRDLTKACLIICFLGGFLFHLAWEAKCQYALPYYLMLFPYGMEGFRLTLESLARMREQWREKEECNKRDFLIILWRDMGVKLLAAVFALVIVIGILPESMSSSMIKLGTDTAEYIWFCQNNG